jgi:hypothetical protein
MVAPWIRNNQPPRNKSDASPDWHPSNPEPEYKDAEPVKQVLEQAGSVMGPEVPDAADESNLRKLRKAALVALAEARGIKDTDGLTKVQLINLLK